ncbi:head-tail adaptor protein [Rhizobium laguerreae]|uniref:head-tail adaptor protein n=1 Tax=Rhizobium laguerreae TaxID=1076926 RepID=UPI001C92692B|nr:head-tail adaptor protein [Rhizobium laguerreae]MBY3386402.1 head-tail adaptor protein [Rhizobium laguerreae]MBY3400485.1 head-tail adaptor protein [Rhizobium laguerreae]MBY3407423.1 head-tail adaptor protein [Rhizobium laguerreae]
MTAGNLRSKLHFQQRGQSDDGYGGTVVGEYSTVFTDAAEIIPRMGTETVIASRLQGVQPFTIRVRSSTQTRELDATWRALDARTTTVYSIVSPPTNLDQKNAYIEMLATTGVQTDA